MQLTRNRANRKTVGRPKGGASAAPAISVGLCWQQFKAGSKLLHVAKQTSQHPPSPKLCVQNQRATQQAITLADVNFTPILQGQSHPRTVKIVKLQAQGRGRRTGKRTPVRLSQKSCVHHIQIAHKRSFVLPGFGFNHGRHGKTHDSQIPSVTGLNFSRSQQIAL